MQEYEYLDDGGRALCRLHHRLRCDECFYVSELQEQNKRYREALELLVKQETIGNDVKTGKTAISYNGMIALKGLGIFNDDNYIVYGVDEIVESVLEESK